MSVSALDIAFVVHHYDRTSGTGGYVVELSRRLAGEHRVTVYASGWAADLPAGVRRVQVPALQGRAYATIMSFPAAFAAVRGRHDIVHAQGWVTGRAHVVTTHIVMTAWRAAARRAGVRSPLGERLLGGFVTRRERALVRRSRAIIAPSASAAGDIQRWYGREKGVTVIHHGFPPSSALPVRADARRRLGLPADGFVALYGGDARKGLAGAMRAVADAPGVQLLVASGSAPAAYLETARVRGIADRVVWAGNITDMRVAFAAADVLLHPTIYDTFAMVIAEALAYGVPAIVTPEAGAAELLEHKRSAWVLEGADQGAAAALLTLKANESLRRTIIEGGGQVAARRSWDDVAAETVAVYRSVLS